MSESTARKYLDENGLRTYDGLIKAYIDERIPVIAIVEEEPETIASNTIYFIPED